MGGCFLKEKEGIISEILMTWKGVIGGGFFFKRQVIGGVVSESGFDWVYVRQGN